MSRRSLTGRLSISEVRASGRWRPDINDAALDLIAAAEELRDGHAEECGCDRPGSAVCGWTIGGALLAAFEFDEVVTRWP